MHAHRCMMFRLFIGSLLNARACVWHKCSMRSRIIADHLLDANINIELHLSNNTILRNILSAPKQFSLHWTLAGTTKAIVIEGGRSKGRGEACGIKQQNFYAEHVEILLSLFNSSFILEPGFSFPYLDQNYFKTKQEADYFPNIYWDYRWRILEEAGQWLHLLWWMLSGMVTSPIFWPFQSSLYSRRIQSQSHCILLLKM